MTLCSLIKWWLNFTISLNFFAGRREDSAKASEITGILSRHLQKHCSSWLIILDKVLVKLIEQFDNLKEYFLNTFPALPGFNGKRRIGSTAWYKHIRQYLTDKHVLILMYFVVIVTQYFQSFLSHCKIKNSQFMFSTWGLWIWPMHCSKDSSKMTKWWGQRSQQNIGASKLVYKLVDLNTDDVSNHKVNYN